MLPAQLPDKVIHLWVDPHYGDDAAAVANNAALPVSYQDASNAVLLHQSWPFKTITRAIAAIPTPLPYPGTYATWTYAIIHALPGMYQRTLTTTGPVVLYPHNGLEPNGETFPIQLPSFVSVQGTSALNTMFNLHDPEAGAGVGPAFQFGASGDNSGVGSFIDSVSIFGAEVADGTSPPGKYAGIYLGNRVGPLEDPLPYFSSLPTISNCFIFGNGVGVAVDAGPDPTETGRVVRPHYPRLINNTIAWNTCGLWNGQTRDPDDTPAESQLALVNNIFDASPVDPAFSGGHPERLPRNWLPQGYTDFEGVDESDLKVLVSPGPPAVFVDFNAYEEYQGAKKFQRGWSKSGSATWVQYPKTVPPNAAPTAPEPSRNIAEYTGWRGGSNEHRGILYVRDLLYNAFEMQGAMLSSSQPENFKVSDLNQDGTFDLSPGDFRLSPSVAEAGLDAQTPARPWAPGSALGAKNPLIDNGWHGDWPNPFVLTMKNLVVAFEAPGPLPHAHWPFNCWDHDCEGYGNPRVLDYAPYANGADAIDIGADEVAEQIVAGYRFGTTHFQVDSTEDQPTPWRGQDAAQNRYLFFLGPDSTHTPSNTQAADARPRFSWQFDDVWDYEWILSPVQRDYYWPGKVDVMPHLLPDIHPWWFGLGVPANPVWQNGGWHGFPQNPLLYLAPGSGIINPPGSGVGDPTFDPGYLWLDFTFATDTTQFGPHGQGPTTVFFGDWCMPFKPNLEPWWDDLDPAVMPVNGTARRFSLEFLYPLFGTPKNLQSFMVWKRN